MSLAAEVGLFVDFDGLRGAAAQASGDVADCQLLIEKARQYGPVAMAYAYADFSSYPPANRRGLEIAGITPRDVPAQARGSGLRSSSSMAMLMDIVDCLLDNPNVSTLVLVTADPAFVRVIARARNRFGKRIVISGPRRAVSDDLVQAADSYDPLPDAVSPWAAADAPAARTDLDDDETSLLQLVHWLSANRPYMTFSFIRSHALSPHHHLGLDEGRVVELLSRFKELGILIEGTRYAPDGRALRTLHLSEGHAALAAIRDASAPAFESRQDPLRKGTDGEVEGEYPSATGQEPSEPAGPMAGDDHRLAGFSTEAPSDG